MNKNIIDKNLSRIIKVKLCTSDINSLDEIEDISIQDINLMQRKLNIDLTEIVKLKKLKDLSLKFFEITDSVIESINQLEFIERIEFSMCVFKTTKKLTRALKSTTIYNCENFNINMLNTNISLEELEIIHSGIVKVNELEVFKNLKILKLSDCNIISIPKISSFEHLEALFLNNTEIHYDIDISSMKKLDFISLSGSKVGNKNEYMKKLYKQKINLIIEFEENNLPIE